MNVFLVTVGLMLLRLKFIPRSDALCILCSPPSYGRLCIRNSFPSLNPLLFLPSESPTSVHPCQVKHSSQPHPYHSLSAY